MCNSERNTSFPEYAIVFYLEKYGLETIHLYKGKGYELDITDKRLHHEIYLSDARITVPEKLRTVIRHPIKVKGR